MPFPRRALLRRCVGALGLGAAGGAGILPSSAWAARDPARVAAARQRIEPALRERFAALSLAWPPRALFLRSLKREALLEVYAGASADAPLQWVRSYPVCAASGVLGPKRRQGDLQVPEGFYAISQLNPTSSYHLSLRVDYPNARDRAARAAATPKGATLVDLGGDIMVHGNCVTIGCIPIEDEPIEEVYLMVEGAKAKGAVPIHIFPARLDDAGLTTLLAEDHPDDAKALWRELAPGYRAFEESKRVPRTAVKDGRYVVTPRA
jgi:murein L,D-transpeptidase YafK